MCGEDYALIALAETTKSCVRDVRVDESTSTPKTKRAKSSQKAKDCREDEEKVPFTRRLSFTSVRSNLSKLRVNLRHVNCFKGNEEEEIPMMDVPRHKSIDIDIGAGLARRVSLFLFTRRSVCIHPYHPYTPRQTVRKFYMLPDEKHEK